MCVCVSHSLLHRRPITPNPTLAAGTAATCSERAFVSHSLLHRRPITPKPTLAAGAAATCSERALDDRVPVA